MTIELGDLTYGWIRLMYKRFMYRHSIHRYVDFDHDISKDHEQEMRSDLLCCGITVI